MSEPMPTRYSRTARIPIVVHIICERCGQAYSISQTMVARAYTALDPRAAEANARVILGEQFRRMRLGDYSDLDSSPCPQCGYEQSWMLQTRIRASQQLWAYVASAVVGIALLAVAFTGHLGSSLPFAILIALAGAIVSYAAARSLVPLFYRKRLAATHQYPVKMPTPELASAARHAGRAEPPA